MSMRQLKISASITNRESQSLGKYLQEISKMPLMTAEEENTLFPLVRQGDKKALDRLTQANLRFVVSVAKQYQHQGMSLDDLINEGNIGLINAAKRFDDTKGFRFISYAVWWVRQSILQALANDSQLIRLPYNKKVLDNRIKKAHAELEQTLERPASAEEIAELLEVDITEVESRLAYSTKALSLDTPLNDEEDNSLLDVLQTTDGVNAFEGSSFSGSLRTEIDRIMSVLKPRQREMLYSFFGFTTGFPMSLEEIARKHDLTTERVRQIKDKAIQQLRTTSSFQLLRGYLAA